MTPEEAFRYEPEFRGELQPFSFLRQSAALALGLSYGRITDDDLYSIDNPRYARLRELRAKPELTTDESVEVSEIEAGPEKVQMYNGLLRDVAIVMWLCKSSDKDVQRARRKPSEYEGVVDKFADDNGITLGGDGFEEAAAAFFGIMSAVSASKGEPKLPKGQEGGDNTPLL